MRPNLFCVYGRVAGEAAPPVGELVRPAIDREYPGAGPEAKRERAGRELLALPLPSGDGPKPDWEEQEAGDPRRPDAQIAGRVRRFSTWRHPVGRTNPARLLADRAFDGIDGLKRIDPTDERAVATLTG